MFKLKQSWMLLPLRLVIGFGFIAHGWAKLSRGPAGFARVLEQIGAPAPAITAWVATFVEILGGLAILSGAFVTYVAIPLIVMMAVAMFTIHARYGFSAINTIGLTASGPKFGPPGYEVNLLYIAGLITLIVKSPADALRAPLLRDIRSDERRTEWLEKAGLALLRYGLVFLLLLWGSFKFFAFEANGIQPLVLNSPVLSWLDPLLGIRGTSALIGVIEIIAAVLIALRRWSPRLSAYGSVFASAIFVTTLSFLFTTPGALAATSPFGGFLMKDLLLLGAALFTSAESFRAARGISP